MFLMESLENIKDVSKFIIFIAFVISILMDTLYINLHIFTLFIKYHKWNSGSKSVNTFCQNI